MADQLFHVRHIADLGGHFAGNEKISCLDGSSDSLFLGTNLGRIVRLVQVKNGDPQIGPAVQLPMKLIVTQIIAASALNSLVVLSASTLYFVEMNSLKVRGSRKSANISSIAVNSDPINADAFALQLALATTNKQILVCELMDEEMSIAHKIAVEQNAITVCYSRHCICYATHSAYFVYNICKNVTHSLFPYDANITRPLIVSVDSEEFLINGMQGLAVFATSAGVSSRPPLFWGTDPVIAVAYRFPHIFVLTITSLIVFRCDQASEAQRTPFHDGTLLKNVDGQIFFCSEKCIYTLKEVPWIDRAEILFAEGRIEECLQLAEDALSDGFYDEANYLMLNTIRQKAALKYFFEKRFVECAKLAKLSEMDPRELIGYCEDLLPLPSGFRKTAESSRTIRAKDTSAPEYFRFLEELLLVTRDEPWAKDFRRDVDAVLVRLIAFRETTFDASRIPNLSCSLGDCELWLRQKGYHSFLLHFAFSCGELQSAYDISRDLHDNSLLNSDLQTLCLENLSRVTDEKLLLNAVSFLLKFDPSGTVNSLSSEVLEKYSRKIVALLEPYRMQLIWCLEKIKHLQVADLHTKLALLYIDELNRLEWNKESEKEASGYRDKLRHLLLESDVIEESKIIIELRGLPHFAVERLLLLSKKEADVSECLNELLQEHRDFNAAELLCASRKAQNPHLYRTLLRFYLKTVRERPEFAPRITNLLNSMETTNAVEVVSELPDDWPLADASSFLARAITAAANNAHADQLKISAITEALKHLSMKLAEEGREKVVIDDHTRCGVCGGSVGLDDACRHPDSTTVMHRACAKLDIPYTGADHLP